MGRYAYSLVLESIGVFVVVIVIYWLLASMGVPNAVAGLAGLAGGCLAFWVMDNLLFPRG